MIMIDDDGVLLGVIHASNDFFAPVLEGGPFQARVIRERDDACWWGMGLSTYYYDRNEHNLGNEHMVGNCHQVRLLSSRTRWRRRLEAFHDGYVWWQKLMEQDVLPDCPDHR